MLGQISWCPCAGQGGEPGSARSACDATKLMSPAEARHSLGLWSALHVHLYPARIEDDQKFALLMLRKHRYSLYLRVD